MAELLIPEGMEDNPTHVALVLTFEEAAAITEIIGNMQAKTVTHAVYEQLVKSMPIKKAAMKLMLVDLEGEEIDFMALKERK